MKNRKKIIIISLIIIIVVAILIIIFKPKSSFYELVKVERKNIEQVVSASGSIKPSQIIDLQFETSGQVRNVFIEIGDNVEVGQMLVKLDDTDLQAQYQQGQAAIEAAQARLGLLEAGASLEEIKLAETEVENAKRSVSNSQQNLIDVKNKTKNDLNILYDGAKETLNDVYLKTHDMYYKLTIDLFDTSNKLTFQTLISQAKIDVENNRPAVKEKINEMFESLEELNSVSQEKIEALLSIFKSDLEFTRGFLERLSEALNNSVGISSTTLTTYKTNLNIARTNINTAISNVLSVQQNIASQKIANQISINAAKSSLDSAIAVLARAEDQLLIKKTGARSEDIDFQKAQVRQQQASLLSIVDRIKKTSLIAPINGVVTRVNLEKGTAISPAHLAVSMNSLGNFEIELDIPETDITKVKPGQMAKIYLDALPREQLPGHITKINPAETIIHGIVYYKATVVFDEQDERVKSGMTANIDIIINQKENVLVVPLRSIIERNNSTFVRIIKNEQLEEKEIVTGASSPFGEIEVVSGLSENEEIVSFVGQR